MASPTRENKQFSLDIWNDSEMTDAMNQSTPAHDGEQARGD